MTPTRDPLAPLPSEEAADAEQAYEDEEEIARLALRIRAGMATSARVRQHAHLRESGHLTRPGLSHARKVRRRLAIRTGHPVIGRSPYIVLRRGASVVRLPFA